MNRWIRELLESGSGRSGGNKLHQSTYRNVTRVKRPSVALATGGTDTTHIAHISWLRRVLLTDVFRLCVFFGQDAMDRLLLHLLTFMNDLVGTIFPLKFRIFSS